jgi:hypothetical protein
MTDRRKISERERSLAVSIYENFREKSPRRIDVVKVQIPNVVAVIGHVEALWKTKEGHTGAIDYRTTHGKKVALYRHDFAAGSRPLLCVSPDGRQLLLLGGRYKFTERGIVDRDAADKEIENHAHGTPLD